MLTEVCILGVLFAAVFVTWLYFLGVFTRSPPPVEPEVTAETAAVADPVLRRWRVHVHWKYAPAQEVLDRLGPLAGQLADLEPLLDALGRHGWFDDEAMERVAGDDDLEVLYDSLGFVSEESAVQYRTFTRIGHRARRASGRLVRSTVRRVRR